VAKLFLVVKSARPRQWLKNLGVFSAIIFTGQLLEPVFLRLTLEAFISFCLISSASYFLNDLIDIQRDKLHPFKKLRPMASGELDVKVAIVVMLGLMVASFFLAARITPAFFLTVIAYFLLQIAYSLYLKQIPVIDILVISAGFILRVFGGEVATGFHINIWLMLTVVSLSLFLAVGKRRSELTLISNWEGTTPAKIRNVLGHYSQTLLDVYAAMFANAAWITYALFAFLSPPLGARRSIAAFLLPFYPAGREWKWLMATIPVVIYGIMRYLQIIYEKKEGESPEKVLLSDRPLMISVILWGLMVFAVIYIISP